MGRIRAIKPEFPQDEVIGSLSRDARLLYVLIWTVADDEGRFRASPALLRSQLYPYDDIAKQDMASWLRELAESRRIDLYAVDGQQYGVIPRWRDHQKIERPSPSRLPSQPEGQTQNTTFAERSPNDRRTIADTSVTDRIGREGIGRDQYAPVIADAIPADPVPVESTDPEPEPGPPPTPSPVEWPQDLNDVREALEALEAPEDLHDPPYWRSIDEWLGRHPTVAYLDELAKYLAWWRSQSGRKRHRKLKAGLRNWLAIAEERASREAQRKHQWQQRPNEFPGARRR